MSQDIDVIPANLVESARVAMAFAQQQIGRLMTAHPDAFPLYTTNGYWHVDGEMWTNWCEGFLSGMIWIMACRTGDTWWREQAEHYARLIEHRKDDHTVHDLGFLFWSSWKRWYDLSGDEAIKQTVIHAGRTLALRFHEQGRFLRSFVAPDSCFIDIMMNVGIIFYAAQETGDADLRRIADAHCLTTRRYLVRGDGSTAHEGIFNLDTGAFVRQTTHQGWRDDSSWARGQAWALYGFGTAYAMTGDERFLDTAQRCADFYLLRTPLHGIPPNDWEEPVPRQSVESSAAAIAARGLWQLADLTGAAVRSARYRAASLAIVQTLCTPVFLASSDADWQGILKHGSYHERKGLGVNESVMWGDYFFVDMLDVLLRSADERST